MIIVYIILGLLTVLWLWYVWSRRRSYWLSYRMPGCIGLPLIGMAYKRPKKIDGGVLKLLEMYRDKYGSPYVSWMGPFPFLVVTDPETCEKVLTSPLFLNKSAFYDIIRMGIGDGVLTSRTPKWNAHRRIMAPAFSHRVLLNFFPIFNGEVSVLLKRMDEMVDCGEVNLIPVLQQTIFEIVSQTTMGSHLLLSEKENSDLRGIVQTLLYLGKQMIMRPWLYFDSHFQLTKYTELLFSNRAMFQEFVGKLIDVKMTKAIKEESLSNGKIGGAKMDSGPVKGNHVFIDIAIEKLRNGEFNFNDVVEESNIMVFAAYETSVCTLSTALMCLAMHPQYQDLVFEETKSILGEKTTPVTYDDLQKLVYTEMVINESMRLFSPAPIISRVLDEDVCIHKDVVFPKGLQVAIDIYNMQRDEQIWGPKAKMFDPDHFLPANLATKHPYSFIPFSKGQRNCLGYRYAMMSLKLILAKIIRNYKVSTTSEFNDLRTKFGITLKFKKLPCLRIERR